MKPTRFVLFQTNNDTLPGLADVERNVSPIETMCTANWIQHIIGTIFETTVKTFFYLMRAIPMNIDFRFDHQALPHRQKQLPYGLVH